MTSPENHSHPPQPRGARPDGETEGALVLIKKVSVLRATYQVRLLAFRALSERKTLLLVVPLSCRLDATLDELMKEIPGTIQRGNLAIP
jgi:hypothetical protein